MGFLLESNAPGVAAYADHRIDRNEKTFLPIADGFKQYESEGFVLHQAKATSLDPNARTITFQFMDTEKVQQLPYHSLVIATGSNTPTPLTSLHGSHRTSIQAMEIMNKRLPNAKSVIIAGGGPVGVETAGEIGDKLNGQPGFFGSRPSAPNVKVTLITSSDKLLPILSLGQSNKAERFLNRVGVEVMYKTRVEKADLSTEDAALIATEGDVPHGEQSGQKTRIYLSNGETMEADIYIPAIGARPNTSFVPKTWLNEKGYVKATKQLRVIEAGPRVYVAGDCGDYTEGGMMSLQNAVPVAATNLTTDLTRDASKEVQKKTVKDKDYTFKLGQTQLVPIGKSKAVVSVFGYNMPSAMGWGIKGRDYMVGQAAPMVNGGKWS